MIEENMEYDTGDEAVQKNLSMQFKAMESKENPPAELKKEVFSTLDSLTLLGDITDLFTAKFTKSKAQVIDLINPIDKDNKVPGKGKN